VYVGLDFLIDGAGRPRLIEANVGLPGGAEEYDRTHRVRLGTPSGALLQEHVDSRMDGHAFSLRSVTFAGEWICLYANLAPRPPSNHGVLAYVAEGDGPRLSTAAFDTVRFDERSWEARDPLSRRGRCHRSRNLVKG
jgi:hypothetical protein